MRNRRLVPGLALLLPLLAAAGLACAGKMLRYDAGAFAVVVSKGVWIEHADTGNGSLFTFRVHRDGPACVTVELQHQGGGACAGEQLAEQQGNDPACAADGTTCFACVELEGSAAQLHTRGYDDLECGDLARVLLRTLWVKPALHR